MYRANFDTRKQESDARDSSGWSASQYNKTASFVYSGAFTAPVLELLNAQPGERILDVGCGSGEVTLLLQKIVEQKEGGMVVGTDFSESMVKLHFKTTKRERRQIH
jgi:ubiquinone/menaquinone biosynthesis C-methylase UbiE